MADEITIQKQNLLKSQIFDKGYDLDHFSQFMDSIKENGGSDIDVWQLEELGKAISQYQKQFQPKPAQMQQSTPQINQLSDYYSKTFKCRTFEIEPLRDIIIQIRQFEKKPGGIFSSPYFLFFTQTSPQQWIVKRKISDFQWLRNILVKQYPGLCIPPLPKKPYYQEIYIPRQMDFLERFLNEIVKNKITAADKYFQGFLQIADEEKFKTLQKDSEKANISVSKLENIVSPNGECKVCISPGINKFLLKINDFHTTMDAYYKRVIKQSKQLLLDFDQITNTMYQLGDTFAQMYNLTNKFNEGMPDDKNNMMEAHFITFNNMMVQWGDNLAMQIKHIEENFINFYKFYHHQTLGFKEYLKQRDQTQYEYEKFKQKLDSRKEKLFSAGDISRWEVSQKKLDQYKKEDLLKNQDLSYQIMLPKDTSALNYLKDAYGYYNNAAYEETKRLLKQNTYDQAMHFINFSKVQSMQVQDLHIVWADTIAKLQTVGTQQRKMSVMEKRNSLIIQQQME